MTRRRVLGIIPARGGSKGVPRKNVRRLCGRPLLAYTIEAALGSRALTDLRLSTDSEEIAEVARGCGLPVDELRPAELAQDHTPTLDVLRYEVDRFERRHATAADLVVLLQPTTPLRTRADIDGAVELLERNPQARSAISAYSASAVHPRIMYTEGSPAVGGRRVRPLLADAPGVRRQEFEGVFVRNGAVYVTRRDLLAEGRIYCDEPLLWEMERGRSFNVDEELDLLLAAAVLSGRVVGHE